MDDEHLQPDDTHDALWRRAARERYREQSRKDRRELGCIAAVFTLVFLMFVCAALWWGGSLG